MAIPANVYRVVPSGSLPGGEIWASGWWVAGDAPDTAVEANAVAQLWMEACMLETDPGPFYDLSTSYWSNQCKLERVSIYSYPAGGPTADVVGVFEEEHVGAHSSALVPNQIAMCVSMRTGLAGRRARGRAYMPINYPIITPDGQFGGAMCTQIADDFAGMFSDWTSNHAGQVPSVVSSAGSAHHPITTIIIDSRPDVQRRRANRQTIDSRAIVPVPGA